MNNYPHNWPEIARTVKDAASWRCIRCGHPHESPSERIPCDDRCDARRHPGGLDDGRQRVLTVHHLDGDKSNCAWWNLAALCQVCHLHIQAKVSMSTVWMFGHSDWFKPYVAGYYASLLGLPTDRSFVMEHLDQILTPPALAS